MTKIALFASGSGTNVENIINYFNKNNSENIFTIFTNNNNAFVIKRAEKLNNKVIIFNKTELNDGTVNKILKNLHIDFIVLAGFLLLVPKNIVSDFKRKIINVHPALLPKYGGKGMYGINVHNAVFNNKEKETGITIHYVNEVYDDGDVIFQAKCKLTKDDTPNTIAEKIHVLEQEYFPQIIEKTISIL